MQSGRAQEADDILPGEETVAQMVILGAVRGDDVELFGDDAGSGIETALDLCVAGVAAEAVGRFERVEGGFFLGELEREAAAFFEGVEDGRKQIAVVII